MDLAEFMDAVGARVVDVATATGLDKAIVVRVRDRDQVPSGPTLLRLQQWAEAERKRKRLPASDRLSFDYLLDGDAA